MKGGNGEYHLRGGQGGFLGKAKVFKTSVAYKRRQRGEMMTEKKMNEQAQQNGYFIFYVDYKGMELETLQAKDYLDMYGVPYKEVDVREKGFIPPLELRGAPALDTTWGIFTGAHEIRVFAYRYYTTNGFRYGEK